MPSNTLHRSRKNVKYEVSDDVIGPLVTGIATKQKIKNTSIKLQPNCHLYTCGDNRLRLSVLLGVHTSYESHKKSNKLFQISPKLLTFDEIMDTIISLSLDTKVRKLAENRDNYKLLLSDLAERVRREEMNLPLEEYRSTNLAIKHYNLDISNISDVAAYRHDFNKLGDWISAVSGFRLNFTTKKKETAGYCNLNPNKFPNKMPKKINPKIYEIYAIVREQIDLVSALPSNSLARKFDYENLCFRNEE